MTTEHQYEEGAHRVVEELELPRYVDQGWQLVRDYEIDVVEMVNEMGRGEKDYRGYQAEHIVKSTPHVLRQRRFVLRKDKKSIIAEKDHELTLLKRKSDGDFTDWAAERLESKKALDSAMGEVDNLNKRLGRLERDLEGYNATTNRLRRIETDIAKVRKGIGDKAWAELTAEDGS